MCETFVKVRRQVWLQWNLGASKIHTPSYLELLFTLWTIIYYNYVTFWTIICFWGRILLRKTNFLLFNTLKLNSYFNFPEAALPPGKSSRNYQAAKSKNWGSVMLSNKLTSERKQARNLFRHPWWQLDDRRSRAFLSSLTVHGSQWRWETTWPVTHLNAVNRKSPSFAPLTHSTFRMVCPCVPVRS